MAIGPAWNLGLWPWDVRPESSSTQHSAPVRLRDERPHSKGPLPVRTPHTPRVLEAGERRRPSRRKFPRDAPACPECCRQSTPGDRRTSFQSVIPSAIPSPAPSDMTTKTTVRTWTCRNRTLTLPTGLHLVETMESDLAENNGAARIPPYRPLVAGGARFELARPRRV